MTYRNGKYRSRSWLGKSCVVPSTSRLGVHIRKRRWQWRADLQNTHYLQQSTYTEQLNTSITSSEYRKKKRDSYPSSWWTFQLHDESYRANDNFQQLKKMQSPRFSFNVRSSLLLDVPSTHLENLAQVDFREELGALLWFYRAVNLKLEEDQNRRKKIKHFLSIMRSSKWGTS